MSVNNTHPSNHHRQTAERFRVLAVASDVAVTASELCSVLPDDGGTATHTPTVGYGRTSPATATVTVSAAIQGFIDEKTATNRPPEDRASHLIDRTPALRTRPNGGPTPNEHTSVIPPRHDDAVFEDVITPTQRWHYSRGESLWT